MKNLNQTEELFDTLFKESLENASAQVPPGVWEGVSGAVSSSTVSTVAGVAAKSAIWMKAAVAALAISAVSYISYQAFSGKDDNRVVEDSTVQPVVPNTPQNQVNEPVVESPKNTILNPLNNQTPTTTTNRNESNHNIKHSDSKAHPPVSTEVDAPVSQLPNPAYSLDANLEHQPFKHEQKSEVKAKSNEEPGDDAQKEKNEMPDPSLENTQPQYTYVKDSSYIFIPNVVTPDGDGINDTYLIKLVGEEEFELIIYSTDNQILFRTKNKYQSWNCKLPGGEDAPAGTYLIKVIYKFKGSEEKVNVQKLTLIK